MRAAAKSEELIPFRVIAEGDFLWNDVSLRYASDTTKEVVSCGGRSMDEPQNQQTRKTPWFRFSLLALLVLMLLVTVYLTG